MIIIGALLTITIMIICCLIVAGKSDDIIDKK